MQPDNPFLVDGTRLPLVAICGLRNGYIQLAANVACEHYAELPDSVLIAARAWAEILESHEAERVYWITLSEVVRHLHIHLYPRWAGEEVRGLPLFEQRAQLPQPDWTAAVKQSLAVWAEAHQVHVVSPSELQKL